MTDIDEVIADHERIWLEPGGSAGANSYDGREWCQDDVWTGNTDTNPDHETPTEYVRADLYRDMRSRAENAEAERDEARGALAQIAHPMVPLAEVQDIARNALTGETP